MNQLVLGCGYLGERVAAAWRQRGGEVYAVTRSESRAAHLRAIGLRPIVGDLTRAIDLSAVGAVDTALFAVGYDRTSGQSIREVYVDGLRRVLDRLPPSVARFIYISSTGVYGRASGEWLDETSPCQPTRAGGQACWEAESLLRGHPLGSRAIILRLAGIYGPGRLPKLRELCAGQPLAVDPQGFLNLIHADDAVAAVLAAERLEPPDLILVSDGCPVQRGAFYRELARQCGAPEPTFAPPEAAATASSRLSSDKRIDNRRMRERLQLSLLYPSYREGLAAIVASPRLHRGAHGLESPHANP